MKTAMELERSAASATTSRQAEFEELVSRYYRQAYNLAYRLTGNAADAEDLTQDAFVKAYRFLDRYDRSLPFMNWFNRLLTNLFIDDYRKKSKARYRSLDEPLRTEESPEGVSMELTDPSPGPEEAAIARQYDAVIQEGLAQLPAEFRTAVALADLEGYSYEEIAEIMRCSIGTVRSRIHRGRKQLRSFLERRCPELSVERGATQ
ncbi:MAG: sigma-70 family RNA polymerase sigma factor [Armatimonadetes bacterium]|nr:sigma-70 family RNA polymerase sigma factor [Armatimonadota bacterium]